MAIDIEDDIVQDFLVESKEILEGLNEQLVDLEQRPDDKELLNSIFRGFHTIKGGAGFLNLEALVALCHRTEDLFNLLRQGDRTVDADLMDTVLQALDVVMVMFGEIEQAKDPAPAPEALLKRLEELNVPDGEAPPPPVAAEDPEEAEPEATEPASEAPAAPSAGGDGGDITDEEFEALLDALDGEKAPKAEAASKPAESSKAESPKSKSKPASGNEISDDEFEALLDDLHGKGKAPTPGAGKAGASDKPAKEDKPKTPDKPASSPDQISDDEFEALLDELHGKGKAPTPTGGGEPAKPAAGGDKKAEPAKPKAASGAPAAKSESKPAASGQQAAAQSPKADTTVRVDTAKLDDIMNLVGELVLVRNRLSTLRADINDERMTKAVSDLEIVTGDLQSAVMKTRMQPIKKVFGRFPRLIRDLARSLKKEVDLELRGEDTDLDKNLVEALADPLIHLVRNAVDHGIEEPADRQMAGKSRGGHVLLSAEQEGDHILLTIADDGKGMDADFLRRKAVEKGLMDQESAARLDDQDCYNLIFMPGFSTKAEISDISGRGVGMDVVKNRISQLNGTIDIDSKLGEGTTMRIKVPLTLAILPTLMVKVKGRKFALPMSVVREIFELDRGKTNVVDGRLVVMVRQKAMPLFFVERWLKNIVPAVDENTGELHNSDEDQVVTVVLGNQALGFVVDEVIGLEEVVIKPLGAMLQGLPGLAGSTITGDGRIALIVDIPSLVKAYGTSM